MPTLRSALIGAVAILTSVTVTSAVMPATAAPSVTAESVRQASGAAPVFPGDPGPDKLYVGASLGPGQTIDGLNASINGQLGEVRRYFKPSQLARAANEATDILAHGAQPWLSTKTPNGDWAGVASGKYDSSFLIPWARKMATVSGPVWLTLHHEPRGDGKPADFRAMYAHALPIFARYAPNTALVPILNGYSFTEPNAHPEVWKTPGVAFIGVDFYNQWWTYDEQAKVGSDGSKQTYRPWTTPWKLMKTVDTINSWGYRAGIGEFGVHQAYREPTKSADFIANFYRVAKNKDVVAISYFNSGLNSPRGSWVLDSYQVLPGSTAATPDESRLRAFALIVKKSAHVEP